MIEAKKNIVVPNITKTPGSNSGAQFNFMELLLEKAEIEVYMYSYGHLFYVALPTM